MLTINIILEYTIGLGRNHFIQWEILFAYLAILIYYMGIRGYQQLVLFSPANAPQGRQASIGPSIQNNGALFELPQEKSPLALKKYGKGIQEANPETKQSGLEQKDQISEEKYKEASNAILKAFSENKIYLNAELNLQMLARKVNLSPAFVSVVIKSEFKKNFRNLVNEYRVREVKEKLDDPRSSSLSLLGIAYECGFNSEASFYRIFKNISGLSPKEYLLRQQKV